MCTSLVDTQSATAEIRRGKKKEERKKETTGKTIMTCPILYGGHKENAARIRPMRIE